LLHRYVIPSIPLYYSDSHYSNIKADKIVPLIKISNNPELSTNIAFSSLITSGISSGQRSAIVFDSDKFLRLKGCGFNDRGFILHKHKRNELIKTCSGCQLDDEHLRELYFSEIISSKLHSIGYHVFFLDDVDFKRKQINL